VRSVSSCGHTSSKCSQNASNVWGSVCRLLEFKLSSPDRRSPLVLPQPARCAERVVPERAPECERLGPLSACAVFPQPCLGCAGTRACTLAHGRSSFCRSQGIECEYVEPRVTAIFAVMAPSTYAFRRSLASRCWLFFEMYGYFPTTLG